MFKNFNDQGRAKFQRPTLNLEFRITISNPYKQTFPLEADSGFITAAKPLPFVPDPIQKEPIKLSRRDSWETYLLSRLRQDFKLNIGQKDLRPLKIFEVPLGIAKRKEG